MKTQEQNWVTEAKNWFSRLNIHLRILYLFPKCISLIDQRELVLVWKSGIGVKGIFQFSEKEFK